MVNAHGCCALTIEDRVRKAFSVHESYVPSVVPAVVEQPSAAVEDQQQDHRDHHAAHAAHHGAGQKAKRDDAQVGAHRGGERFFNISP